MVTRLAVVALLVSGCTVDEGAVDPRVRVIPVEVAIAVTETALEVPRDALPDLSTGDIVVSAYGEGVLRTVDAIRTRGNMLVLATSDAELTDALVDAQVDASLGQGKADTYQLPRIGFSVQNKKLYENAAMTATLVDASLSFEPALDLELEIADRRLENFEMVLRGKITGSLDLDVSVRDVAIGPEIRLWESPPAVFYQQVGFVPVVETVTTSVVLRLQAVARGQGRVRVDASAIANFAAGLRYTADGGWDGVADFSADTHGEVPFTTPELEQLGVRAWLAARADVRFYGVAGPFIAAGPQLEVVRNADSSVQASAGFRGQTGGGLRLFRLNLPALPSLDLFDWLKRFQ